MSVLSEIYVSRDAEAVKYDTTPEIFSERAQYKGMTPLELSTLWAIIREVEWDDASMDAFVCLLEMDGGERLIHAFPTEMVTALGELSPEEVASATASWAETEELSCPAEDIRPVVEDMVRLARSAATSGRGLYLWNCV